MNKPPATMGRNFIQMMRPVLGLEGVPGIRNIRIEANYNEAATVEVDMIARPDWSKVGAEKVESAEPEYRTRRYTVTVTEVME